jgi:hypothetical protein
MQADHDGVAHDRMGLQRLLHFFREDLLATGVDAHRAAAQQLQGSILVHLRPSRRAHSNSGVARRRKGGCNAQP